MSRLLSSGLFCIFLLITPPVISHAQPAISSGQTSQELPAEAKDIRIIDESGEEISVSTEDIRIRLLNGNSVHFAKDQEKEEKRTIEADWITKALKSKKPVDIKNAIIIGDLDLRVGKPVSIDSVFETERVNRLTAMGIKNVYLVSSPISIVGSTLKDSLLAGWKDKRDNFVVFQGKTNFNKTEFSGEINNFIEATFSEEANFGGTTFSKKANFLKATFSEEANFGGATFSEANFRGATFSKKAYFGGTTFSKEAYFRGATFSRWADFRRATFSSANFRWTTFSKEAYFLKATFSRWADFRRATFSEANFRGATFSKKANFARATFSKANFRDATFSEANFGDATLSEVDFREATFREADFSGAVFEGELPRTLFNGATFQGKTYFKITIFKGGANFTGAKFLDNVYLQKASYPALRISWRQLKGHLDSPLRELEETLKNIKVQAKEKGKSVTILLQEKQDGDERSKLKKENFVDWQEVYLRLIKNFEDIGDRKSAEDVYYYYRKERPKFKTEHIGEASAELAQLPPGLVFPHNLIENIRYDEAEKRLVFRGAMAEDEKDELQKLSDEPQYKEAVENLFQMSQSLPGEYVVRHSWWEKTQEWVEYIFFGLTCGYGVRPLWALAVGGILIVVFTLIYFSAKTSLDYAVREKGKKEGRHKNIHFSEMPWYQRLGNCFYFSVSSFATVGFGRISPRGYFKVAAIFESVLGWLTLALFLVTLANVWLR